MFAAILAFAISLLVVVGAYWLFVLLPENRAARALRRRLKAEGPTSAQTAQLTRRAQTLTALKGLDTLLGRSGRLLDPLRINIEQSGLPITPSFVFVACVSAGALLFGISRALAPLTWLNVTAALAAGALPYLYVRHAAAARVRLFEEQFPQAMDLIANALRAGHAFTTGVAMVADEIPEPTAAEFRLLSDQHSFGMPLPDALKALGRRIPLLDARFFITAVLTQREAGGNLAEVLDNLAGLIRERARIKRQVRVASAHGRITGLVLSLMPPSLAALMFVVAPEHMRAFVVDPLGVRMIIGALVLQFVGTIAIRRIVNVEF
jgi:tight adherence protein B